MPEDIILDGRPTPRYLSGIPTRMQEVILRTVESELERLTQGKRGIKISQINAERYIANQLELLKYAILFNPSVHSLRYSSKPNALVSYAETIRQSANPQLPGK